MPASFLLATRRQRIPEFAGNWIYFGEDWTDMHRWESGLPRGARFSYAAMLAPTFERAKPDLVAWVSGLAQQYRGCIGWWMNALSGKNVMWSPFFLHVCYLDILAQIRDTFEGECLVVCDDWYLLLSIEEGLRKAGFKIRRAPGWRTARLRERLIQIVKFAYRWFKGSRELLAFFVAARLTGPQAVRTPSPPQRKQALIHTCVDDTCLGEGGRFTDRYYGPLAGWLERQGYDVTILPWLFNVGRTALQSYRWFRNSPGRFLLPEDELSLADYFRCARQILGWSSLLAGDYAIRETSVTHLVRRERYESSSRAGLVKFLLYDAALRRWIGRGNRCDLFVDLFENHAPERPQISALRACSPHTSIVGYQHGAATPPEFIPYTMTATEWESGMLPDRIVCSGKGMREVLHENGFPASAVVSGPALRYGYLLAREPVPPVPAASPRTIVALFPLEQSAAAEMWGSLDAIAACLHQRGIQPRMLPHPMMGREGLLRVCGISHLPEGWRWAEEGLQKELRRAAAVVAMGTNAQFDAAACAVPVVCLARELGFTYNFLDRWSDRYPACKAVARDALEARLSEILDDPGYAARAHLVYISTEITAELGPIDEEHLRAFIE